MASSPNFHPVGVQAFDPKWDFPPPQNPPCLRPHSFFSIPLPPPSLLSLPWVSFVALSCPRGSTMGQVSKIQGAMDLFLGWESSGTLAKQILAFVVRRRPEQRVHTNVAICCSAVLGRGSLRYMTTRISAFVIERSWSEERQKPNQSKYRHLS